MPQPAQPSEESNAVLPNAPELTVVVPTYNERGNVAALVERLHTALNGIDWSVLFVDDDSPDGTALVLKAIADEDPHVYCLRRVGRRGLSGAVIEGALAARAPYLAVMDGDLQHDEALLPAMLAYVRSGQFELVVGTRFAVGGRPERGLSTARRLLSAAANAAAQWALRTRLTDPMSGFFLIRRDLFERVTPRLSRKGFKILFDLIASQPRRLSIRELPYAFGERMSGKSKMDGAVAFDYAALLALRTAQRWASTKAAVVVATGAAGALAGAGLARVARRR